MRDLDGIWFRVSGFAYPKDLHVGSLCLTTYGGEGKKLRLFGRGIVFLHYICGVRRFRLKYGRNRPVEKYIVNLTLFSYGYK